VKVGSIVQLASGGPIMTVAELAGGGARVIWTDEHAKPHELSISTAALRLLVSSIDPDGGLNREAREHLDASIAQAVREVRGE
jgi:uncharacterized protein YodC (DUF2158 family)